MNGYWLFREHGRPGRTVGQAHRRSRGEEGGPRVSPSVLTRVSRRRPWGGHFAPRPLKAIALGHGHGQERVGYSPLGRSEKKLPKGQRGSQGGQELGSHWVESVWEGPQNGQGVLWGGTSGLGVSGKEPAGNRLPVQGKGGRRGAGLGD